MVCVCVCVCVFVDVSVCYVGVCVLVYLCLFIRDCVCVCVHLCVDVLLPASLSGVRLRQSTVLVDIPAPTKIPVFTAYTPDTRLPSCDCPNI